MSNSNFIDYVKIHFRSGNGGAGAVHFHRAKFIPKGGPDGGDGGKGGDIVLRGNENVWTLLPLKYRKHISADDGKPGAKNHCTGESGENIILDIPPGTIAVEAESGKFILEVGKHMEEKVLLKGGRGGLGNSNFKSSTNQTPRHAQPGEDGEEKWIVLELKVLADVGLVGFPNAGKSTLLSALSAAKPKVADYPFTTLVPQLGIVKYREEGSFVMADIPGIIEGAHDGKGLGLRFLRHIERNAVLIFMVSAESEDITKSYRILKKELELYKEELNHKESLFVISKADLLDEELKQMLIEEIDAALSPIFISSVSGEGIQLLKDKIWKALKSKDSSEE